MECTSACGTALRPWTMSVISRSDRHTENGDTVRGELAYLVNMALREPRAFAPVWAKGVPVAVEGSLAGNITIQVVTGVPRDPVDGEPSPT